MRNLDAYYDKMVEILKRAEALRSEEPNEASTRLQVVDDILELLGWQKADFYPEESTLLGDYTDYLLKSHRTPLVVVEAKRMGRTFALPDKYKRLEYKAEFLRSAAGQELKEAMLQAASYCNQTGTVYAVVTNGWQWIIFRGLGGHRQPWTQFPTVVFSSSDVIRNNFVQFWNLLSKDNVLKGSLQEKFQIQEIAPPRFISRPNSCLQVDCRLPQRPDIHEIGVLFDYYFDDIVERDNGKMLQHCFVEDKELHEYKKELQVLLKERALSFHKEVDSKELTYDDLLGFMKKPTPENKAKVVLVVGRVGAGKTTFLNRFFGRLEEEGRYARFILDLLHEARAVGNPGPDEIERLCKFILERVSERYLKRKGFGSEFNPYDGSTLRTIFGSVVHRLQFGPKQAIYLRKPELFENDLADALFQESKDSANLLPKYMQYITGRTGKPFCLVIDNIDRASDQYQRFVYAFVHELSHKIRGIIVISLRETTYWRARKQGFLDTRVSDMVFHVSPPNLKTVISKRLKYLNRQAEDPTDQKAPAPHAIRPYLSSLAERGEYLRRLLLERDDSARLLITCLANRSVRRAFFLLRQYADSPFGWQELDKQPVRSHVLRALLLRRSRVFDEANSEIVNMFSVPKDVRGSHWLPLRLLAYLEWARHGAAGASDSPIVSDVTRDFETWGFPTDLTMRTINRLVAKGLVESDNKFISKPSETEQTLDDEHRVNFEDRISLLPAGHYYLTVLATDKIYNAYCAGDSFWYDEESFNRFMSEYNAAIDLAESDHEALDDLVPDSQCFTYWMSYLRSERMLEQKSIAESRNIAWRNAIGLELDKVCKIEPVEDRQQSPTANRSVRLDRSEQQSRPSQLQLFAKGHVALGNKVDLFSIAKKMPPLSEKTEYQETTYLPRILWTLEFVRRAGIGAVTAARLADLLSEWGKVHVHNTNMARYFRACRTESLHLELWSITTVANKRCYLITEAGSEYFRQIFANESNSKSIKTAP